MAAVNNPFLSSPPASQGNIVDLFGGGAMASDPNQSAYSSKASDDLLQLGNPFADMFGSPAPPGASQNSAPSAGGNNMWMGNGRCDIFFALSFRLLRMENFQFRIQWICWKSKCNGQFICVG